MPEKDDMDFRAEGRNIQYTTKVAKLLNQTETGIARALADESENFLERQYGRVFVALDLGFTSDTYDIGEVLIETLEREYFSDLNRSAVASFEHALTVVNQTLADLAVEGENDWVGKLNAVLGVLHENEIHLSKTGFAEAYLVRGHTITNITESLNRKPEESATAKTFLNIASGELEVGDKVLISNGELFNYVSVSDVRRHLYLHPPNKAIRKIADQVLAQGMPERLAAVVAELTTIDLISSETVSDDPDEIVLGAPRRHFEALQRFKPLRKDTPIAQFADTAKKHWERRIRPGLQRGTQTAAHKAKVLNAKRKGEAPPPPPPRAAAGTPATHRPGDAPAPQAAQQAAAVIGRVVRALLTLLAPLGEVLHKGWDKSGIGRTGAWRAVSRKVSPIVSRVRAVPLREHLAGSRRIVYRNLILLFGLVLILSMAISINATQNRKTDARIRGQIKEVEALQAKAEASYIFKDFGDARKQLGEAKAKSDSLSKEKRLKADIAAMQGSVSASYDRINNVTKIADQPVTDFGAAAGGSVSHLAQSGNTVVGIGEGGPLVSYNQSTKETKQAVSNTGITGRVKSMATTSNGDVLLYTDKPTVYQFDATGGTLGEVSVAPGSNWEQGEEIDTVQQSVFILDVANNQVWRHARTLSSFNKGEPYFSGAVDLKGVVDMVTGTQVMLLKGDGTVLQFSGGQQENDFKIEGAPAPETTLEGANVLAINPATGGIYVGDPKRHRILEFNGKGEYARQFTSSAFANLEDLTIDDKTATLYVLSGSKLYAIPLGG